MPDLHPGFHPSHGRCGEPCDAAIEAKYHEHLFDVAGNEVGLIQYINLPVAIAADIETFDLDPNTVKMKTGIECLVNCLPCQQSYKDDPPWMDSQIYKTRSAAVRNLREHFEEKHGIESVDPNGK